MIVGAAPFGEAPDSSERSPTTVEWICAATIAGIAAALLWSSIDASCGSADSAHLLAEGRRIAVDGARPLVGPGVASGRAGHWTGPLVYYLLALPFALRDDFTWAVTGFAVLRGVATLLWWRVARALLPRPLAFAAATVSATLPAQLNEQLLIPMIALQDVLLGAFVLGSLRWIQEYKERHLVFALVALGALTQLHVSNVAFAALLGLAALVWRRRPPARALWLGAAGAASFWLPWLVAEVGSGGANTQAAWRWLAQRTSTVGEVDDFHGLRLLGRMFMAPFRLPQQTLVAYGRDVHGGAQAGQYLDAALVSVGAVVAVSSLRRGGAPRGRFLAGWLASVLGTLALGGNGVYSFHLMGYFVAVPLLWASALEWILARVRRRTARVGLFAACVALPLLSRLDLFAERVAATREIGYLVLPPESVLSAPDALWREVVPVRFPIVRDVPRVASWWRSVAGPEGGEGRLHGLVAAQLKHSPPFFQRTSRIHQPVPAEGPQYFLGHQAWVGCRGAADDWIGPYCARALPPWLDFSSGRLDTGGAHDEPVSLPVELKGGAGGGAPHRLSLQLRPGPRALRLSVVSFGPYPIGTPRLDYPTLSVLVDGAQLEAEETTRGAMLLLAQEARFLVEPSARPRRLEILAGLTLLAYQLDVYVEEIQ